MQGVRFGSRRDRQGGGGGGNHVFGFRSHVFALAILQGGVGQFALLGVVKFNVADRAFVALNVAGDAVVAVLAGADLGPFRVLADTDLALERFRGLRKILGEDAGRSRAFRTVDRGDPGGRKFRGGIQGGDGRIVPEGDLTQVDLRQDVAIEFQRFGQARDVVGDGDGAHDHGDVNDFSPLVAGILGFFLVHRGVGATEIDHLPGHLLDAVARTGFLVVNRNFFFGFVNAAPLLHDRVDEGRPAAVQSIDRGALVSGFIASGGEERTEGSEHQKSDRERTHRENLVNSRRQANC